MYKRQLTREVLERCPNLRFIGVLATGYNVVDIKAARQRGIPVANIPTYGTDSVGQFAIALLLEICHHIGHHDQAVHQGKWESNPDWCFWDYPLIELGGKIMGVIGYGRIGQATGRIEMCRRDRTVQDPLMGTIKREKEAFEEIYNIIGQYAIVLL